MTRYYDSEILESGTMEIIEAYEEIFNTCMVYENGSEYYITSTESDITLADVEELKDFILYEMQTAEEIISNDNDPQSLEIIRNAIELLS